MANIGMLADDNGAAGTGAIVRNAGHDQRQWRQWRRRDGQWPIPASRRTRSPAGTINVNGNADPASGTRNFGVWVDGAQGGRVGHGRGQPGRHRRDRRFRAERRHDQRGAGSVPRFVGGTDQIGFFAAGTGSTIQVSASTMTVDTERATLFRGGRRRQLHGRVAGRRLRRRPYPAPMRAAWSRRAWAPCCPPTARPWRGHRRGGSAGGAVAIVNEGGATGRIDARSPTSCYPAPARRPASWTGRATT